MFSDDERLTLVDLIETEISRLGRYPALTVKQTKYLKRLFALLRRLNPQLP